MPLAEYQPKTEIVKFPGGEFSVRGISLPDVALLIGVHEYVISMIVDKVRSRQDMFNSGDQDMVAEALKDILGEIVRESPILIANLIAICADEEAAMSAASRLPLIVQMDALTKIVQLSFNDLASIKKFAADVMSLIRGMVPAPPTARRPKK